MTEPNSAMLERLRQYEGAQEYTGDAYFSPIRYFDSTKHMLIFDVLSENSQLGEKGQRKRMYMSEDTFQKARQEKSVGHLKFISHACVCKGNLYYDRGCKVR